MTFDEQIQEVLIELRNDAILLQKIDVTPYKSAIKKIVREVTPRKDYEFEPCAYKGEYGKCNKYNLGKNDLLDEIYKRIKE